MSLSLNFTWDPSDVLTLGELVRFTDRVRSVGVTDSALLLPIDGAQDYGFYGWGVQVPKSAALRLSYMARAGSIAMPEKPALGAIAAVWQH